MRSWLKWRSDKVSLVLILILFISHLPFINSDPDFYISTSRGPFTDEGLNTIQVRNLINHGYLSLSECDNLLKTPVFGALTGLSMSIFGTRLPVARLTVLILLTAAIVLISRKKPFQQLMVILIPVIFLKYQVFHFSHYSLAEMLSVICILSGIYFLHNAYLPFRKERSYIINALASAAFFSLAYYLKIQFIYVILIVPIIAAERFLYSTRLPKKTSLLASMVLTATTVFFLLFYLTAWYLPFKGTYDYMMAHQSGGFHLSPESWGHVRFNIDHFMFSITNILFTLTFLACIPLGIYILYQKTPGHFPLLFKTALLWFFLELHKLTMVYLPTRYQVSLFASMGLVIAVVIYELYRLNLASGKRWPGLLKKPVLIAWMAILTAINLADYSAAYTSRKYAIQEAIQYLVDKTDKNDVVIGAWAPSLTWQAGSRAMPVWKGFLNDRDPLKEFQPAAVISEPDEADSEQAYLEQGTDLSNSSDSIRTMDIGPWKVNIYWIKTAD
jgi:hypothetical protein